MKKTFNAVKNAFVSILAVATILSFSLALSSCSKKESAAGGKVRTVIVGTGTKFDKVCYLDENGVLSGYEIDVIKAIDDLLPDYKFEFETFEFKDILISLSTGKIDMGAHQFEENDERRKNYLFSNEVYTSFILHIEVPGDNDTIHSIDDLQGKKVLASVGDNGAYMLEQYNKNHPDNPIELIYMQSPSTETKIAGYESGRWDAATNTLRGISDTNERYGTNFKAVGEPVASSFTYYLYKKGDTALQEAVDGAIKQLKSSGKLAEISIKNLGADYTEGE